MLYTFGQYIVNVQWSITGDKFLTILKFGIRVYNQALILTYLPYSCSFKAALRGNADTKSTFNFPFSAIGEAF